MSVACALSAPPVGLRAGGAADEQAAAAAVAEERYLASIRRRIAWQSERAAHLRSLAAGAGGER